MGSRINKNLKHVFHCFMEVRPGSEEGKKSSIVQCYPENYKEKDKIPEFVFPCKFTISTVELFSFALTNMEGKLTFGFCRHAPRADTALVVVSALPWHEFFYKMLNTCANIMHNEEESGLLQRFLYEVYNSKMPLPGQDLSLEYSHGKVFSSGTPDPTRLPSIPENKNLMEYYNFVDINNMITVFFSMLNERRVIVTSHKLSRLTACVQAANSLLYPLSWQHLYVPILPLPMIDHLAAPFPFLIGVPDVTLKRMPPAEIGEVVILDADNNTVKNPFEADDIMPQEVASNLKKSLKLPDKLGDHVARSFLQAMVHLIGGYRDAMRYRPGEKITFDSEAFIHSRSSSLQPFLKELLQIQMFQTFKDERLELLNGGKGYSDEFELECVAFTEKSSRKFTPFDSVKKDGGALIKKVKNKTNPVVKDAMKNVIDSSKMARERVRDSSKMAKSKAKATINEVRSKLRDNHEQFREDSGGSAHSAPSSPSNSRRSSINNYQTLPSGQLMPRQNTDLGFTPTVLKYDRFDPSAAGAVTSGALGTTGGTVAAATTGANAEDNLSPKSEDFNLMQDIDEVFNKQKPSAVYSQVTALPSATFKQSTQPSSEPRKSSVGDLINLNNDDVDTDIFDPLASLSNRTSYANHKKLSRTDGSPGMNSSSNNENSDSKSINSFLYPSQGRGVSNNSQGKYENYVPPGGANQTQFKHFVSSMTDSSGQNQSIKRSSEDLLKDYGLHELSSLRLGNQMANLNPSCSRSTTVLAPDARHPPPVMNVSSSNTSIHPHSNGFNKSSASHLSPNSSIYQYSNGFDRPSSVSMGSVPQPPPRSSLAARANNSGYASIGGGTSSSSVVGNSMNGSSSSGGIVGASATNRAINTGGSTVSTSKGNNSFLFSSPIQPSTNFQLDDHHHSQLPVNQRVETMSQVSIFPSGSSAVNSTGGGGASGSNTNMNNNHYLSDLDPLCKPSLERTNVTPVAGSRQPPAIPPRGKKQWTTFD